jgi:cobalt-zinc-cadmium efflux system membrane fusion protein
MTKRLVRPCVLLLFAAAIASCGSHDKKPIVQQHLPDVKQNGALIIFYDTATTSVFKIQKVSKENVTANVTAPAKVSATVVRSGEDGSQKVILFEDSDLATNYTLLIQHQTTINQIQNVVIKQKQIELDRMKDLQAHGAASGKDLLMAQSELAMEQTNLANEKAALIEHETKLKAGGFNPEVLKKASAGTAYITCDIPESEVSKITKGGTCKIQFTSFPTETFKGKIDDLADVVDNSTRMVKLRINLANPENKLKAGMFALVSFGVDEGNIISINKTALITVQGRNYVFVKDDSLKFERKEVKVGSQMEDKVLIYDGLAIGSRVVIQGAIQLKGLSFGY